MAKIFITGSTDGIGFLAARQLINNGHEVHLHARNERRSKDVRHMLNSKIPVFIADLSDMYQVRHLADELNMQGKYDAIIHNAGVTSVSSEVIFRVNVLAPYLLTTLVKKPKRLIYLSSSMHRGGKEFSGELDIKKTTYSDSKLFVTSLSNAFARLYPDTYFNSVDPGWVPTRMGGKGAPDDLQKGYETQVWLAVSNDKEAMVSGKYFFHQKQQIADPATKNEEFQNRLIESCERIINKTNLDQPNY